MPASLPGSTAVQNAANPSVGLAVLINPFSGPKGSPFGGRTITSWSAGNPVYTNDATNLSTGGLQTGIGFGSPPVIGAPAATFIKEGGFTDDYTPGVSYFTSATAMQSATTAILTAIGGGKSSIVDGTGAGNNGTPASEKVSVPAPYAAQPILMAGQGGSRDAGAGPAFTGFGTKLVTAVGTVANGVAVETGFLNRSGVSITVGQSVFGSATAASPAVT